jgi:uncharacterized membrane protein
MSTTILSILLGIGGMFGWGIYDFLGGVFSKQIGSFKSLFWSQLAGLAFLFLLSIALKAEIHFPTLAFILAPIASMVYSAGYLFFFKGFEKGNVSIVAATMNLWAVFTMLFAFFFMGQRLTLIQTTGVLMIISGATLASLDWGAIKSQQFQLSLGVREAILGAFFFGVFWNISEMISEEIGWLFTTLLVKLGIAIFLLIYSFAAKQEIRLIGLSENLRDRNFLDAENAEKTDEHGKTSIYKALSAFFREFRVFRVRVFTLIPGEPLIGSATKTKSMIFLMGLIEVGAVALVNYGLTIGDAILITPIASALSIVTITLAVIFLKDKISKFQGFGFIMAIAGIIATAF